MLKRILSAQLQSLIRLTMLAALFFQHGAKAQAVELSGPEKAKVEEEIKQAQAIAKNPALIAIVTEYNLKKPKANADMDQDKWQSINARDSFVIELKTNKAANILQTEKSSRISEMFVSGADGTKVAFLSKTSGWSHKGKPKHDEPMSGKVWIGTPELDKSTAVMQVQFAVPILQDGKAIGSLVCGVDLSKL